MNLFVYSENNPVNDIDPWGLQTAVMPGAAPAPFPAGHPVFQPGSYENQLIVKDLAKLVELADPRPLFHDLEGLFETDETVVCEARRRGSDPAIRQADPADWGPLSGAPGSPDWEPPNPNKPPKKPDPKKWKKMSRWQKMKWILKNRVFWGAGHILKDPHG